MLKVPKLFVEGKDDISVINALLLRHGLDTEQGKKYLSIKDLESAEAVLGTIPDAIRASTDVPVGFVIDIDETVIDRWKKVCNRLQQIEVVAPLICPPTGFVGKLPDYPYHFGIWLMPDCQTDDTKLENLIATLIPDNDPLWPLALSSVAEAARITDEANQRGGQGKYSRFRDVDRIKSEIHTWLAWRELPGAPLGAAINSEILRHDSPQAIAFLQWIKGLYGFSQLTL